MDQIKLVKYWSSAGARGRANEVLRFTAKYADLDKLDKANFLPTGYAKYSLARLADPDSGIYPDTLAQYNLPWFGRQEDPLTELETAISREQSSPTTVKSHESPTSWKFHFAARLNIATQQPISLSFLDTQFSMHRMHTFKNSFHEQPLCTLNSIPTNTNSAFFSNGNTVITLDQKGQNAEDAWSRCRLTFEVFMAALEMTLGINKNIVVVNGSSKDGTRCLRCPLHYAVLTTNTQTPYIELSHLSLLYTSENPNFTEEYRTPYLSASKFDDTSLTKLDTLLSTLSSCSVYPEPYHALLHSLRCYLNALESPVEHLRLLHFWQSAESLTNHYETKTVAHRLSLLCNSPSQQRGIQEAVLHFGKMRNEYAHSNLTGHPVDKPSLMLKLFLDRAITQSLESISTDAQSYNKIVKSH